MARETKVIIYSDLTLQAEAWSALLQDQPFIHLIGSTSDLDLAKAWVEDEMRAAVLVDSPDLDRPGAEAIVHALNGAGVVFLVPSYEESQVIPLIQAGSLGCVSRAAGTPELIRALIAAGRGELALPSGVAQKTLLALARQDRGEQVPIEGLTEREREVLSLVAQGLMNKDIAQSLFISVRTVEAHLRNVYKKLDINSRTEAALWAVQNGFGPARSDFSGSK